MLAGVAARRAVLLAFIDDHSRLLVGWRWGTGEDVFRLEAALRAGLMARGVPDAVLVDRGSAFVSSQLLRACALCRRRHNAHYSDSPIMPTLSDISLQLARFLVM
jgi:transposase InsO family protein